MESLTIDIFVNSDGDFNCDIYESAEALENGEDALDGCVCTSEDIKDALEMVMAQALELIANSKKDGK